MKRAPNIIRLEDLAKDNPLEVCVNGQWVPARPLGFYSIWSRLRCAWMVFTGRADAFIWPEDDVNS